MAILVDRFGVDCGFDFGEWLGYVLGRQYRNFGRKFHSEIIDLSHIGILIYYYIKSVMRSFEKFWSEVLGFKSYRLFF